MKNMKLEIHPQKGFGDLDFAITDQQIIEKLGDPDATEVVDDDQESISTILWDYIDTGFSLFLEGDQKARLSACETDNPDTTLFGEQIFDMSEDEIINLMKENHFQNIDIDDEIWGERRVSFDDALIDFYFKNDRLVSVNWGVVINEKGEVEWYNE